MKNYFITMKTLGLLMSMLGIASVFGQTEASYNYNNPKPCGLNDHQDHIFDMHPEWGEQNAVEQQEFQSFYEDYMNSWSEGERASYVIPVVVHIVHLGGPENISNEQVYDAIDRLNQDFSALNNDISNTHSSFQGIVGNPDIEFRLATKDPSGNCHSGITRTYSQNSYDTGADWSGHPIVDDVADEHGVWPQNRYMNVFVCLDPNGAAGYTNNPGNWYPQTGMYGGILMRHDYMGTIGTSSMTARHTLSHEVGHWLNLSHTWGPNNNPGNTASCGDDDGVNDTPNTIGWTSCNVNGETCGSLDNVQNIMEYSYCSTMFTDGQVARMHAALNSSTAGRNNLWTTSNLNFTGTNGPGALCEADFSASITTICAGQSIDFTDDSFHTVTSRTWTFNGGSPASSSASNPSITYNTPGVYSVALQVSDGSTSLTETKNNYIVVLANPGDPVPYSEGFEPLSSVPDNDRWTTLSNGSAVGWQLSTSVGYEGLKSAYLNNYVNPAGSVDELMSGSIDLSGISASDAIVFNFKFAYRKRSASNDESLKFYISKDCGQTWALRKIIDDEELGLVTASGSYVPAGPQDFVEMSITNITSTYYTADFRFKFVFESDGGNNLYIDNINLYPASMSSLDETNALAGISLYPNPTTDHALLQFNVSNSGIYEVVVYNAVGQQVLNVYNGDLSQGLNQFEISTGTLPKGLYYVRVEGEGVLETLKLIKN